LWGKLARAYDAKSWEAQATEQDLRSTELTIEGTVAKLYWQLAYLNQRLAFADASLAYARKTLDLINVQYKAGAASKLDVLTAERSVSSQEASRTDLIQERSETRNAMAIMFDAPPSAHIDNEPQALSNTDLPAVIEGLPAEILARRPDLSAAELRLRKSLANIDVARANFYPSFSLTGSLGTGSTSLTKILSDPVGALALNLALPFLNWNENQLNLKVSKSSYDQAVVEFRQTLYTAMSDVENILSARTQYALKAAQLKKAWESAKESERLYEVRYRAGASSLKDWLDAQEARRQAQSNLIANQYNQYINQVTLSLALGG
jgi:NodT family efflux transporter outer membrane factor (OMF) lipoprotein